MGLNLILFYKYYTDISEIIFKLTKFKSIFKNEGKLILAFKNI